MLLLEQNFVGSLMITDGNFRSEISVYSNTPVES
jgi:hypothetical protein